MNLVEELCNLYDLETWHQIRLSKEEAYRYHDKLLQDGNIITVQDGELLCGYVEQWRINFEQFGRLVCREPFSAFHENIINGQIAYVANVFVKKEYRSGSVIKKLRNRFFEFNSCCTHFVGSALRKTSSQPIKVFRREDIFIENKLKFAA